MQLTVQQQEKLKNMDLVEAARKARKESNQLLNDQGFSVFAVLISNLIAEMAEHPEKLIKEFIS